PGRRFACQGKVPGDDQLPCRSIIEDPIDAGPVYLAGDAHAVLHIRDAAKGIERQTACGSDIDMGEMAELLPCQHRLRCADVPSPLPALSADRKRQIDRDSAVGVGQIGQFAIYRKGITLRYYSGVKADLQVFRRTTEVDARFMVGC